MKEIKKTKISFLNYFFFVFYSLKKLEFFIIKKNLTSFFHSFILSLKKFHFFKERKNKKQNKILKFLEFKKIQVSKE
jgi:hypothetical protein